MSLSGVGITNGEFPFLIHKKNVDLGYELVEQGGKDRSCFMRNLALMKDIQTMFHPTRQYIILQVLARSMLVILQLLAFLRHLMIMAAIVIGRKLNLII
jgi:hypothetical protein